MSNQLLEYRDGETLLEGYLALPDSATGPVPLVLVAHDWTGRRDFACRAADRMAEWGYAGFALDMFGKGVFGKDGDAEGNAALMNPLASDRGRLRQRILAGLDCARQQPGIDTSRIAAIGYCFGGMCVLELARAGADVLGVVSIHGIFAPGEIDNIINDRLRGYVATGYYPEKGQAIFSVFCSMCHEINGQGGNIGPQLTGVGNWGARALCEKILDPNRNISRAFVTYTITLKDGSVKSGLYRREEGQTLVFADQQGQEFAIDKNNINEQKESPYTLMPDHFRETIPEEDFKHLVSYLLSLKGTNEL